MNRCKMHGGITKTRGTSYAAKPGQLYSKYLTEEERKTFDNIELGTVEAELKLMRVRLERALRDEVTHGNVLELDTRIERDGGGPATVDEERHYKQRDYRAIIQATLGRIESLEKTRAELMKSGDATDGEAPISVSFVFEVVDGRR